MKGANYVMYPAFIILTVGMLLLGLAHNSIMLLVAGVLIGLGFGNMQSCTQAIAVKLTTPQRMGLATSTFLSFLTLVLDSVLIYLDSLFLLQAIVRCI